MVAASVEEPEIVVILERFEPGTDQFHFQIRYTPDDQDDGIVLKVVKKPLVGLLWGGMMIVLLGSLWMSIIHIFFKPKFVPQVSNS